MCYTDYGPRVCVREVHNMKLFIKQKVFSWGDRFNVYDENQNEVFYVEGEVFTFGKKLHLLDPDGNELAFIHQKLWSFLPRYYVSRDGVDVAEVVKEFTFMRQEYSVNGPGWTVDGDFWAHEYDITADGRSVAVISKRWFTWGDTYEIDIAYGEDEILALCVVLIIDAVLQQQSNNSASTMNNNN